MLRMPKFDEVLPVLARPLRLVPHTLQCGVLERALEQLFRVHVARGDLDFLDERCLAIEIEDSGWRWPITLANGKLRVLERDRPADVTIRGQSAAFLVMAGRFADPDTLFFQRRIVIEGDTELGLGAKNFLEGLDEEQLAAPLRFALGALRGARGVLA